MHPFDGLFRVKRTWPTKRSTYSAPMSREAAESLAIRPDGGDDAREVVPATVGRNNLDDLVLMAIRCGAYTR